MKKLNDLEIKMIERQLMNDIFSRSTNVIDSVYIDALKLDEWESIGISFKPNVKPETFVSFLVYLKAEHFEEKDNKNIFWFSF